MATATANQFPFTWEGTDRTGKRVKGKVVATDAPDALTERLRGAVTMFVQAQGPASDIQRTLQSIGGIVRVTPSETRDEITGFDIDTEKGADVRREIASAIVRGGWGLLELRPMRMSLEDIFLSLTTEETATEDLAAEQSLPSVAAGEGGINA